jgi:hypothetical protein
MMNPMRTWQSPVLSGLLMCLVVAGCEEPLPRNSYDEAAQICVDAINMQRASIGLEPLDRWFEAERCANNQAQDHDVPYGNFEYCFEQAQQQCMSPSTSFEVAAQSCAATWFVNLDNVTPATKFAGEDPMTSSNHSKVACGFFKELDGSGWVVMFDYD